jgi:hypothetical protein
MPAGFLDDFGKTEANDERLRIGTAPRGSGRDTGEACRSIEVSSLHEAGWIRAGWAGGWQWRRDGEPQCMKEAGGHEAFGGGFGVLDRPWTAGFRPDEVRADALHEFAAATPMDWRFRWHVEAAQRAHPRAL